MSFWPVVSGGIGADAFGAFELEEVGGVTSLDAFGSPLPHADKAREITTATNVRMSAARG